MFIANGWHSRRKVKRVVKVVAAGAERAATACASLRLAEVSALGYSQRARIAHNKSDLNAATRRSRTAGD